MNIFRCQKTMTRKFLEPSPFADKGMPEPAHGSETEPLNQF
jgi:hypothetical protein